jgi:hypothetical protein
MTPHDKRCAGDALESGVFTEGETNLKTPKQQQTLKTLKQFSITAVMFAFAACAMAATEGYDALPTPTPPDEDRHPCCP